MCKRTACRMGRQPLPLLLLAMLGAAAGALETYPVDFAQVSTGALAKDLSGNCICDLNDGLCDTNCCCDPDCAKAVSDASRAEGRCLPEGPAPETLDYCAPKSYFQRVNLPSSSSFYTVVRKRADVEFLSELLCIVDARNPSLADEYPDPPAGEAGNNANQAQCVPPPADAAATETAYAHGSSIRVTYGASTRKQALRLPYPAFSAECSDAHTAGYLVNLPASGRDGAMSSCSRSLTTAAGQFLDAKGAAACTPTGALSARALTDLKYAAEPQGVANGVPVVTRIRKLDPATGVFTAVAGAAPPAPTLSLTATNLLCADALYSLQYTLYYTLTAGARGQLSRVEVDVVLADVASRGLADGERVVVQQGFKASWVDATLPAGAGGKVTGFSGNPGYLKGFPVLAGTLLTDAASGKTAISRYTDGLPLPGANAAGACSASALGAVGFGANASSACGVRLALGDLAAACTAAGDAAFLLKATSADYITRLLQANVYVGIWGNSDYNDVSQWVKVAVTGFPPAAAMAYDAGSQTCSNVITGLEYTILTGVAAASNNLQSKVLYVNVCPQYGSLTMPEGAAAHVFTPVFKARFVAKEGQERRPVTKPVPPLFAKLPKDIFYPFV